MPKSGQIWDPAFLTKSQLFRVFDPVAHPLVTLQSWPSLDAYSDLVNQQRRSRAPELPELEFFPLRPKSSREKRSTPIELRELYDGSIALTGRVPCVYACYHDLFNAILWAACPRAKHALHARQFRALERWVSPGATKLPGKRTREQDALTVFDEGGSVLLMTSECYENWRALPPAAQLRLDTSGTRVFLFGHALVEHVLYGRPTVRSCALVMQVTGELPQGALLLDRVDRYVAECLADPTSFAAPGADAAVHLDNTGEIRVEAPGWSSLRG